MANRHRGEIDAILDGRTYTLCLTLGALAELEACFQAGDLADLTRQFSTGHLSALQLINIIGAGLRGGGHTLSDEEVAEMRVEGGAVGYANIVSELLEVTFAPAGQSPPVILNSPDDDTTVGTIENPTMPQNPSHSPGAM